LLVVSGAPSPCWIRYSSEIRLTSAGGGTVRLPFPGCDDRLENEINAFYEIIVRFSDATTLSVMGLSARLGIKDTVSSDIMLSVAFHLLLSRMLLN
jgi:hypothetical protein